MAYRQLRARQTETIEQTEPEQAEQLIAYLRQSSNHQVYENQESADIQLTGAQQFAIDQGLDRDDIVIAWEGEGKRGVSGTKRIDQRTKLQEVIAAIKANYEPKTVWFYSVSRLTRERFGVTASVFMDVCAQYNAKVHIKNLNMTFDFRESNPVSRLHIMLFSMLAMAAAQENEDRSRLLHEANNKKAKKGGYNGRPLVPGFIVDRDKKSATFGKFIPYPPHAKVTARLFKRHHEVGAFNLLSREVALMPVVFPLFDASVDTRDVRKFLYKKVCKLHNQECDCEREDCIHIGYHISKVGLFRLLVCVEVAGYWKHDGYVLTDEQGEPIKNHAAIVDYEDWLYAFKRLSFNNLDGSENKDRIPTRNTWVPATSRKGKDRENTALLQGILTSPLGTIQCHDGKYIIAEKRGNDARRSATFGIDMCVVDQFFLSHLEYHNAMTDLSENLWDELLGVQAKNQRALVSVDEQIARYEQTIANKQAVLDTLGATMDKPTMIQYNQDIIDARANLQALQAKKDAATVEENQLTELYQRINEFRQCGFKTTQHAQRFIKLACEKIELNEYSAHFCTLTVTWAAPFHSVDVGYIHLPNGVQEPWTEADEYDLAMLYPLVDRAALLERFPTRTWGGITSYAFNLGYERYTRANSSGIEVRNVALLDRNVYDKLSYDPEEAVEAGAWDESVSDALVSTSAQDRPGG